MDTQSDQGPPSAVSTNERFHASESRIIITGAVHDKPSLKFFRSGWAESRFMLTFQNGADWLDSLDYWAGIYCIAYGALAETIAGYLKIDDQIYIRGYLSNYTCPVGKRIQVTLEFVFRFGHWDFDWREGDENG